MFTGIIEEIGHIKAVKKQTFSQVLVIEASKVLDGTDIGDSIAVNGICLTVTAIGKGQFSADVMHENGKETSLKNIKDYNDKSFHQAVLSIGPAPFDIVDKYLPAYYEYIE